MSETEQEPTRAELESDLAYLQTRLNNATREPVKRRLTNAINRKRAALGMDTVRDPEPAKPETKAAPAFTGQGSLF